MKTKVKDLNIIELQNLISETVRASMEEVLEDIIVLLSKRYLHSIEEARKDYKKGIIRQFEEIIDV